MASLRSSGSNSSLKVTAPTSHGLKKHDDFNQVFFIGESARANHVHEVVARAGTVNMNPLRLVGGIPIHPSFFLSEWSKSKLKKPESSFLTLEMVDKYLSLVLPVGCNKDHPITCPMGNGALSPSSLNLSPFLLCLEETDLIIDTEIEYFEAMKRANKHLELFFNPGVGHSFYLNKIAVDMDPNTGIQTDPLIVRLKEFIEQH